jgi:hypothetical protein
MSFQLAEIAFASPKQKLLYVQVRESKLRAEPQFWSSTVQDLSYGSSLVALGAAPGNKSWVRAKSGEHEGFVHMSAVTSRKIVLVASDKPGLVRAPSSDVMLAGKGFNQQVENHYGTSKGLDFSVVDEVEKLRVDPLEQATFIREGDLATK